MSSLPDSPNIAQRAVRRLIATRPAAWALSRTIHHLDHAVMHLSGGRTTAAALFSGLPIVILSATGVKSGRPRAVPLVGIPDGDRLILIASNWGQARHPAWYYNVRANPDVTVTAGGESRRYVAYEVTGEEREAAWARAVALYPGYGAYAARSRRPIPVIALDAVDGEDPARSGQQHA